MNELYDQELEQAVLGILIWDSSAIFKIIRIWDVKVFYFQDNQTIATSVHNLAEKGLTYDLIDVTREVVRITGDTINDWAYKVTNCHKLYCESTSLEYKYLLLSQLSIQRELIRTCEQTIQEASNPMVEIWALYDKAMTRLQKISEHFNNTNELTHQHAVKRTYEDIMLGFTGETKSYWKTGFNNLDNLLMLDRKNILLVGAKSGAYKTKLVIQMMMMLFGSNKDVAASWYCMEDPSDKIIRVMISSLLRLPDRTISNKDSKLTQSNLDSIIQCKDVINDYDIEFFEKSTHTKHIRSQFINFCKKRPDKLNILIIDNLMCLADNNEDYSSNQTKIDDRIASAFQRIMNETEGLVILIHHFTDDQLSKMNFTSGYRPRESHLKGSTRYRDVSTQIILLNNLSQYPDIIDAYKDSPWMNNLLLLDITKNRNGNTGLVRMFADGDTNFFQEL